MAYGEQPPGARLVHFSAWLSQTSEDADNSPRQQTNRTNTLEGLERETEAHKPIPQLQTPGSFSY